MESMKSIIRCIHNNAFSITFDNHYTINAMFSRHHSCSRYDQSDKGKLYDDSHEGIIEASSCEVSITDPKGAIIIFADETSRKYVRPEELAQLIFKTSIARIPTDITDFDISKIRKEEDYE